MNTIRRASLASLLIAATAAGAGPAAATSQGKRTHTSVATAASLPNTAFAASAYGTYVSGGAAGAGLSSGATATSSVSCTTTVGLTRTNKVAAVNNGVITTGAVSTTSQSIGTATSRTARSTTSVGGVNLLHGLIKASAVSTSATSTRSGTGLSSGTHDAVLTGLSVGGTKISAKVAPNTSVSLKLNGAVIGRVVINEQAKRVSGGYTATSTRALDVYITAKNALGLDVGARIVVGNSSASLAGAPAGFARGSGFATRASTINGTVTSGPTAYAGVACTGGNSTANLAGTSVPALLSVGAATTKTTSLADPTLSSHVTNNIASVGVLANLIRATGVTADTTTSRATKLSPATFIDRSKFTSLSVAGLPNVNVNVAPNTTVNLAGLGKVTFHKRVFTPTGVRVTMIYVVLGKALGGLPTGTVLEIGVSDTSVH